MGYVDLILNLAGLLLWIKWRSLPYDPFMQRTPATLVGTLRRAAPSRFRRWHLLAGIVVLVVLRAVVYWLIGSTTHWTGKLDLGVITLWFRSDSLPRTLSYSAFSFGLTLGIFYFCLLFFSVLAARNTDGEPMHRLVRMQLGDVDAWPAWAKIVLPFIVMTVLWWLAVWLLVRQEIFPAPVSIAHRIEESVVIGLGIFPVWKYVAAPLLVLHLLNTYIYFGKHPFWNYVKVTARSLLAPLRAIPLCAGRVDFAPIVGLALVFLAARLMERGLVLLYARLPF